MSIERQQVQNPHSSGVLCAKPAESRFPRLKDLQDRKRTHKSPLTTGTEAVIYQPLMAQRFSRITFHGTLSHAAPMMGIIASR